MNIADRIAGLSPEKQELLRRRLEQQRGQAPTQALTPQPRPAGGAPLSFAQLRLWLLEQFHPGTHTYNLQRAFRVQGRLDPAHLVRAMREVMRRHEVLRTTLAVAGGQLTQAIADTYDAPLTVVQLPGPHVMSEHPLSQGSPENSGGEAEVLRLARQAVEHPFDLASGPLWRVLLISSGPDAHVLSLNMHHSISDAWSMAILMSELVALYAASTRGEPSPLPDLPIQYADFAIWQRRWLEGDVLKTQLAYWRERLAGAPAGLDLPADFPRPEVQTFKGSTETRYLPPELAQALSLLSQQENATLFMTLLAGFQTLLFRYSGQDDIVVGSPVANRRWAETEGLIGFFANTLVLRGDLRGNPSFRRLLGRVRDGCLGAYANQDVPFEKLVEALQPQRELSRAPLFQVMFALQNVPRAGSDTTDLAITALPLPDTTAKFDLTLYMSETPEGLTALLEFNTDLFERDTARRLLDSFETLLRGIAADPDRPLLDLPCVSAADRLCLLADWNSTQAAHPEVGLHQLFEAQAALTPGAPAVADRTQTLTYAELEAQANQLAHYLKRRGVSTETPVAVCLERSAQMVVCVLAILKAGGAYVALDPKYPLERNRLILADVARNVSKPLLLTQSQWVEGRGLPEAECLCLDRIAAETARMPATRPEGFVDGAQLAYVLYTSGSTGMPKGVALSHRGASALMQWAREVYPAEQRAGVLASTSLCFDLSVFELFVPLSWGGTAIVVETVLDLLAPELPVPPVRLINTVPSAIEELVKACAVPETVLTINLAGEPLSQKLAESLYAIETVQAVYNLYGPSEDTTYSTAALIERDARRRPAIGRPIANTQAYVLDPAMQPVPIGAAGELYLGGMGLARGYQNQPALTAECFLPDPFGRAPGGRLYRTGDRVRYRADGNLEFLGRLDHQVKIRGFRIEPGEIESILARHPWVETAAVLARAGAPDAADKRLVAYLVRKPETAEAAEAAATAEVRQFLDSRLPGYMMPSAFVWLEKLPRTPNGKVDRRALPDPDWARPTPAAPYRAPQTELEQIIADLWREVLQVERVGLYDNFFELGGHSLALVRVHQALQARLGREIAVLELFRHPTVSLLAASLTQPQPQPASADRGQARQSALERQQRLGQQRRARRLSKPEADHD